MEVNDVSRQVGEQSKARYFPNETFLNAKIGGSPSYIWRSMVETQSMLKQGLSCRIGDGQQINILGDPWLPSTDDPYVHSSNEALVEQKVIALMRTGIKQWDLDVIADVMEERDLNLILSIPLDNHMKDTWYWRKEKLGCYSVKSAYMLIQEGREDNLMSNNSGFWRQLRNLKIPSKVKHFLWRASVGCLPNRDILRIKKVNVNPICPMCNEEEETILHILVKCSFAEACRTHIVLTDVTGVYNSFAEWL